METTEGFEGHLRDVLHGADDQAAGFSAAQVIAKGRIRRQTRTATISGIALVAAAAVAIVPSTLGGSASSHSSASAFSAAAKAPDPARAATSTSAAVYAVPNPPASSPGTVGDAGPVGAPGAPGTTTTKAASPPALDTVKPGTVLLGDGYTLKLTSDSMTLAGDAGQVGPLYTGNGNQAPDSISLEQCGRVIAGLYVGGGEATSGTVTVDGTAYATSVVGLAGHPGWSVAYAMLPTAPKIDARVTITVSDATGHVLASFAPPKTPH